MTKYLTDWIRVGVIQTDTPPSAYESLRMAPVHEELAWQFIRDAFVSFRSSERRPNVVLLPELSVPRGYISAVESFARELGCVVVMGVDRKINRRRRTVRNEAQIVIPNKWRTSEKSYGSRTIKIGKVYPAPVEEELILSKGFTFAPDPTYYLFEGLEWGDFGIAICYDLMDLERAVLYKTRIQHLFVLAFNQDTDSFEHLAEGLSRTLFCNVVICNTGYYGGSLAVAPFYKPYRRRIYRHDGQRLGTSQILEIPVRALVANQEGSRIPAVDASGEEIVFKKLPPGYARSVITSKVSIPLEVEELP